MTWLSLREELEEEFAQLSRRELELDYALSIRGERWRARQREYDRARYSWRRCDPVWLAAKRERDRAWHQRNRDAKRMQMSAWRARTVLSVEQRERKRASQRAYQRRRYHSDPGYRARQLEHSKAQYAARKGRLH